MINFSLLPKELQNFVLNHVDVKEKLKFLKLGKQFRTQILNFGPFLEKIPEIQLKMIIRNIKSKRDLTDWEFWITFQLKILNRQGHSIEFLLDENGPIGLNSYKEKFEINLNSKIVWKFVNNFRSCKSLRIYLPNVMHLDHIDNLELLKSGAQQFEFLPKMKSLANLELKSRFDLAKEFLKDFKPNILSQCHLNLSFFDFNERSLKIDVANFLSKPNFTNCKNIAWSGFQHNFLDSLAETQVEFIQISCLTMEEFQRTVEVLLKNWISIHHERTKIKIFGPHTFVDYPYFVLDEYRENFLNDFGLENADEEINEWSFSENKDLLDEFIDQREFKMGLNPQIYEIHSVKTFFKKMINSNLCCYLGLIFHYSQPNPNFQAEFRMECIKLEE